MGVYKTHWMIRDSPSLERLTVKLLTGIGSEGAGEKG